MTFGAPWVDRPGRRGQDRVRWSSPAFYVVCLAVTWFVYTAVSFAGRPAAATSAEDGVVTRSWRPGPTRTSRTGIDPMTSPRPTTHCPYCSLQCGMRLSASATLEVEPWEEFPVNQGGMCRKGWTARRAARPPRAAHHAAGPRRDGELEPADLGRGARPHRRPAPRRSAPSTARTPSRVFGGGGLTNEKAYQLGKFARVALRHQADRLQRPLVHVVGGRPRATGRSASTAGCRSRWPTSSRPTYSCWSAATSPRPCRRPSGTSTALRERGGQVVVDRPAAHRRPPTRADALVQPVPGTDLALALGLLHVVIADGHVDEEYVAARTTGFEDVRRSVARVVARAGRAGRPACRRRELRELAAAARRRRQGDGPDRPRRRAARDGSDTVLAWINLALALGQCRHGRTPATAASPARATARAAASTARRPTSCPATG